MSSSEKTDGSDTGGTGSKDEKSQPKGARKGRSKPSKKRIDIQKLQPFHVPEPSDNESSSDPSKVSPSTKKESEKSITAKKKPIKSDNNGKKEPEKSITAKKKPIKSDNNGKKEPEKSITAKKKPIKSDNNGKKEPEKSRTTKKRSEKPRTTKKGPEKSKSIKKGSEKSVTITMKGVRKQRSRSKSRTTKTGSSERSSKVSKSHSKPKQTTSSGKESTQSKESSKSRPVKKHFSSIQKTQPRKMMRAEIFYRQTKALIFKGLLIKWYHWINTLFEILFPLVFMFSVALGYSIIVSKLDEENKPKYVNQTYHDRSLWTIDDKSELSKHPFIGYAPKGEYANKIMSPLVISNPAIFLNNSCWSLKELHSKMYQQDHLLAAYGIYFVDLDETTIHSSNIEYIIKERSTSKRMAALTNELSRHPSPIYPETKFYSTLIYSITKEYIRYICLSNNITCEQYLKPVEIYQMPYPAYQSSGLTAETTYELPVFILIMVYSITFPMLVNSLVREKSCKIKELMRMNGMPDSAYWLSNFIINYTISLIHVIFFTLFLYIFEHTMFSQTSPSVVAIFFLLFNAQFILLSMFISIVFNCQAISGVLSFVFWNSSYMFVLASGMKLSLMRGALSTPIAHFFCAMTPIGAAILFFQNIIEYELQNKTLTFFDIDEGSAKYTKFTVLNVFLTMLLSLPVFSFLIFFFDNCWPFQEFWKAPYFFLRPSFWSRKWSRRKNFQTFNQDRADSKMFQKIVTKDPPIIVIENVSKSFSNSCCVWKCVIEKMNLQIYRKAITVLLGQNGAGKTTLMNMITGITNATRGRVYVDGYNVASQTLMARQSISFCPQENIFYDELTVYQHLRLFAMLRKSSKIDIEKQIDQVLQALDFKGMQNLRVPQLSGGMKRKLAFAMALVGDPETIVFDEPTSGMDPQTRRSVWDVLLEIRARKNVFLTTHFLEEADILGDRIIIMNKGEVVCDGSPHYLKSTLGTGHRLRIAKLSNFNTNQFLSEIKKIIPGAKILTEIETEVIFSLETKLSKKLFMEKLMLLFMMLEANKKDLKYDSCGLTYSTLEDIFLQMADTVQQQKDDEKLIQEETVITPAKDLIINSFREQLKGLFLKRFHYSRRSIFIIISQFFLPCLMLMMVLLIVQKDNSSFILRSGVLMSTVDFYGSQTKTFYYGEEELKSTFESVVKDIDNGIIKFDGSDIVNPRNVSDKILNSVKSDLEEYKNSYIYGLGVKKDKYELWINTEAAQSIFISMRVLFETILCKAFNRKQCQMIKLKRALIPYNETVSGIPLNEIFPLALSFFYICLGFFPFIFPILIASYSLFVVEENNCKAKSLQLLTSLRIEIYWLSNFVYDILSYFIVIVLFFLIVIIMDTGNYVIEFDKFTSVLAFYLLLFGLGFGSIPWIYIFSMFFRRPSASFTVILVFLYLVGVISNVAYSLFIYFKIFKFKFDLTIFENVLPVMNCLPMFSFLYGYQKLFFSTKMQHLCESTKEDKNFIKEVCMNKESNLLKGCCPSSYCEICYDDVQPFSLTLLGSGTQILYLFGVGLVGILLLWIIEKISYNCQCRMFKAQIVPADVKDEDVKKEINRIDKEQSSSAKIKNILTVSHLYKQYGNRFVVNDLTFGVYCNECFGLLGVNGAGKTTTFSILVGDINPSSGNAFYIPEKFSLQNNLNAFKSKIGYCPQFDAFLGSLTGYETLCLFGRLRGIPAANLKRDVNNLIQLVGLSEYAHFCASGYSGGNKRKLSLAIALVGSPPILLLDEPSCGVDPSSRRKIWALLNYIKKKFACSILLTSHSMDECEALCSRIGILVQGNLKCIGSAQHLRSKYGEGYVVVIMFKSKNAQNEAYLNKVQNQIKAIIPSAIIKDAHQGLMTLHIADPKEKWSTVFKKMIMLDEALDFDNYNVSNTTLEQIFLMFAKNQ